MVRTYGKLEKRINMDQQLEMNEEEKTTYKNSNNANTIRTRRVGSVTFGIALICYGVLFLIHIFVPDLPYYIIFRCWPICFIVLGIEILVENYKSRDNEQKLMYDFPAVLMLGAVLLFAMVMAAVDVAFTCGERIYW